MGFEPTRTELAQCGGGSWYYFGDQDTRGMFGHSEIAAWLNDRTPGGRQPWMRGGEEQVRWQPWHFFTAKGIGEEDMKKSILLSVVEERYYKILELKKPNKNVQ